MRLWEVIKEILRNRRNDDGYEVFLRTEYPQYRREGNVPRYHEGCLQSEKHWRDC